MNKAESTRPLRGKRADSYHRFLMQLVLNRRPSDIKRHFWLKKLFCPPHLGRNSDICCRLPLDQPLADVISNICDAAVNKIRKVNFPHEGSPATFHPFCGSDWKNKHVLSFERFHNLLFIIKYL